MLRNAGAETMSETKHTPLPWRQHNSGTKVKDKSVSAILGSKHGDFRDKIIASYIWEEADGQLIVTSVNARPKVEELVEEITRTLKEWGDFGWQAPPAMRKILAKAREVEAALKGSAQ